MNNQKTLLISFLITAAAIGLLETGVIKFNDLSIHAQEDLISNDLVLEMNGERVTIPAGDWVVAVDAWNPDNYAGGELVGVSADGIVIQEPGKDWEMNIPSDDIGILYHGEYKAVSKYVKQGIKFGGIASMGIGVLIGASAAATENPSAGLLYGLCGTIISGIYLLPGGALVGFIRGMVAEGKAVEYIIGPNDWRIVFE